jgi:diadenosine tetraphosphate (Ap4A) HIT family hydrolase
MSSGCEMCARNEALRSGRDPWLVAELERSVVVLSGNQACPGWCVLQLKDHVEHLAELAISEQERLFGEAARVAAAIRAVFPASGRGGGPPRINYGCLGNQAAHVHWHVVPRHADDPDPLNPVWHWPAERLRGSMTEGDRRGVLLKLRQALSP